MASARLVRFHVNIQVLVSIIAASSALRLGAHLILVIILLHFLLGGAVAFLAIWVQIDRKRIIAIFVPKRLVANCGTNLLKKVMHVRHIGKADVLRIVDQESHVCKLVRLVVRHVHCS